LAYPPWALFPFEVSFMPVLATRTPKRAQPSIDRASVMPCITLAPRLRTVAIAFAPSLVSHDRSCVSEARSVPCPVPVRSRPDCSGIRRIPRRAASPCDDAAQAGRNPVDTFDVAIVGTFGLAEVHPASFSRTDRCSSLLVWCPFGHHLWRPPRGGRPNPASWVREGSFRRFLAVSVK